MTVALGGALTLALAGLLLLSAWAFSRRTHSRAPYTVRACAALLGALWLAVAAFWLLSIPRAFSVGGALLLGLVLLLALLRAAKDPAFRRDLRSDFQSFLKVFPALLRRPEGLLWLAVAAAASVRLLRSLASPPLAWDALTYHLFKAGRFVQAGGWVAETAPDAWGAYEYLSPLGDALSAWTLLATQRDGLLPLFEFGLWLAAQLGVYVAARQLGAERRGAILAATAIASCPAAVAYIGSGYVDLAALAFFCLGSVFVVRWVGRRHEEAGGAIWVAGAAGLTAGVKMTVLPLAVLMVMALLLGGFLRWRRGSPGSLSNRSARLGGWMIAGVCGALAVGAPSYFRAWIERGSPTYPLPLGIAGRVLAPGHPLADPGAVFGKPLEGSWELLRVLLFEPVKNSFVNPGLVLPIVAILALVAAILALRKFRIASPWGMAYCLAAGSALVVWFTADGSAAFRTTHAAVTSGRYLLPFIAALAMAGALLRQRWAHFCWAVVIVSGLWSARPRAWSAVEAAPLAGLAALFLAASASLAIVVLRRDRYPVGVTVAAVLVLGGVGTASLEALRAPHRYALWEEAANLDKPLFHVHRLHSAYASAWPVWQALDGKAGRRVAVTAGWDGLGHNWYRYPLLGRRLQNRLYYVPVTSDGSIIDYREKDQVESRADFSAWLRRLLDEEIEVVVSLMPRWTVEDAWMRGAPEIFEPLGGDERNFHAVFALDPVAAALRLDAYEGRARVPNGGSHQPETLGNPE